MVLAPSAFDSVPVVTDDDRRLVEAHRAGDPDAFSEIVRLHYRGLLASARRRLGSTSDAEDAVQETLLRAFRGLDRFGTAGDWRLAAWLTRILANVCADTGARRQSVDRLQGRLEGAGAPSEHDVADLASDHVALGAVRRAVDALPASQRRAFVLRVVEDLPYPAVARQLGITEDNARARVQRARAALRHVLTDTRAVSGTLAAAPLAVAASLRQSLRHLAGRAMAPSRGPAPAPGASASAPSGTLSVVSTAAPTASSVGAAAGGPMSSGAQLVGQLAASPIGQAAMAVSGSGVGAGKGSLVIGLAASLATAGALAMPSGSPSSGGDTGHAPAHALVAGPAAPSPEAAAPAPPATASSATASSATATVGTPSVGPPSDGTPAPAAGGTTAPGAPVVPSSPSWVQLAAAATFAPPPSGSASTTTAGTGTAGTAGAGPVTGPTATTAPGGGTGTAAGPVVLPPGTCTGVTGFDGVSATQAVPPLSSASMGEMLDTGTVAVGGTPSAPGLQGSGAVSTGSNDPGTRVAVTAGTCLGAGGSLLAVDLADVAGNELQLVGSLVADPQAVPTAGAASGATSGSQTATTTTTYLFRGSATQIGGVFSEGSPLPWGATGSFVAELQVVQPTGTAELTVVFVKPTASGTAAGAGSPGGGSPAAAGTPAATDPSATPAAAASPTTTTPASGS